MKKRNWVILMGLLLAFVVSVPAMATTAIEVDGKTYVVYGDQSTFEADGKTFIIGEDNVRIQEKGKPDRVLELETSTENSPGVLIEDVVAGSLGSKSSAVTVVTVPSDATIVAESAETASESVTAIVIEDMPGAQGARFSAYAKFGLSYDSAQNILYYQGQRVRIFEDTYPLGDNAYSTNAYFDERGTVDVEAERHLSAHNRNADGSYDPSVLLTGLRMLSAEEFSARDLTKWTQPLANVTYASSEAPMTPEELSAFYAPYAEFGLQYDAKTDTLCYQDQVTRRFLDIRKSNGESLESGKYSGEMTSLYNDSGTVDIVTIRDYTSSDVEGNGKLIGLRIENVK